MEEIIMAARLLPGILAACTVYGSVQLLTRWDRQLFETGFKNITYGFALFFSLWFVLYPQAYALSCGGGLFRFLWICAWLGTAAVTGLTLFLAFYPWLFPIRKPTGEEKWVLVLGAPTLQGKPTPNLTARCAAAARWLAEHPEAKAILSGGNGHPDPEAEVMLREMKALGIPEMRLVKEDKSATTNDNFRFTARLLEQMGGSAKEPIVVVTNNFHIFRLRYFIRAHGYADVRYCVAPTPRESAMIWYLRETVAFLRFRLGSFFGEPSGK